jgi:methionine--tRNA ligase beta chain
LKVDDNLHAISKLDIRVGKIVDAWPNPNSEKLYNEKVDIGNGEIRDIASGLQKSIPLDKVKGAMVVVICNLKARKLADWNSHGMVLCAETHDNSVVEFLNPPAGSVPGDLISFAGFERKPLE